MKNLLSIALVILCIQSTPAQQINILSVQQSGPCQTDSVKIEYNAIRTGEFTTYINFSFGGVNWADPIPLHAYPVNTTISYFVWVKLPEQTPVGSIGVCVDKCLYINVINCVTGIEEYQLNGIKPIYFDLQGNRTEPIKGILLIEQRGNSRKKIIIQD